MTSVPVSLTRESAAEEWLLGQLGMGAVASPYGQPEPLGDGEWESVVRQSARHGVAPLLYNRLHTRAPGRVPPRVMEDLRALALQTAVRNMGLYRQLSRVLQTFADADIAVIALKGAYLAEVVYGNPGLRPMIDVDLLVRRRDLARAEARLLEMRYGRLEIPHVEVDYANHHHLRPFVKPGAVTLEIHWAIEHPGHPFTIDVDELWARARQTTIAGIEVLALCPEDLLLHLCLHASFDHRFALGLRSICDIAETIRHHTDEIDWPALQRRAGRWGIAKYVYLTLRLARELIDAAVPGAVLDQLEPEAFDRQVVAWARAQLFAEAGDLSPDLARLWETRRLREKLAVFLKSAFPPRRAMTRMYRLSPGSRRTYLYYPVRWKDLLAHYGRSAWRLVRRDEAMIRLAEHENQKTALKSWLASVQ